MKNNNNNNNNNNKNKNNITVPFSSILPSLCNSHVAVETKDKGRNNRELQQRLEHQEAGEVEAEEEEEEKENLLYIIGGYDESQRCLGIYLSIYLSIYIYIYIYMPIFMYVCIRIKTVGAIYQSIYLFSLSIHPSIYLSIYIYTLI